MSKVQTFMKLTVLPLGQRALAGQSINFPVDVSQVWNALPRPIDESGVILVQSLFYYHSFLQRICGWIV